MDKVGGVSGASADADRGSRASTEPYGLGPDGLRSTSGDGALKIEKGVPYSPRHGGAGNSRFPFRDMEVGDSFHVPWGANPISTRSVLSNAISAFHLRNSDKRFSSRKDDAGVRVWRIK